MQGKKENSKETVAQRGVLKPTPTCVKNKVCLWWNIYISFLSLCMNNYCNLWAITCKVPDISLLSHTQDTREEGGTNLLFHEKLHPVRMPQRMLSLQEKQMCQQDTSVLTRGSSQALLSFQCWEGFAPPEQPSMKGQPGGINRFWLPNLFYHAGLSPLSRSV